jgi:hypothetical protein
MDYSNLTRCKSSFSWADSLNLPPMQSSNPPQNRLIYHGFFSGLGLSRYRNPLIVCRHSHHGDACPSRWSNIWLDGMIQPNIGPTPNAVERQVIVFVQRLDRPCAAFCLPFRSVVFRLVGDEHCD